MEKPKITNQGKAIVERGEIGLLVMLPDGNVKGASSDKKAETIVKNWCKKNLQSGDGIGICTIEWRNRQ